MRRTITFLAVLLLGGAMYVASPFLAAWTLREAIKAGDTATIERKVVWTSVRATLRSSIASNSQLLPEVTAAGEQVKPTMWQRVKAAFGQPVLDRFIESYVTAEGLPKLLRYRKTWNSTVKGDIDDEDKLDALERVRAFYRRMIRGEFKSLTKVEIEMADRFNPDRRYVSVMELYGTEWKLTELRILVSAPTTAARASQEVLGVQ